MRVSRWRREDWEIVVSSLIAGICGALVFWRLGGW
jgi:hypothetical protein